MSFINKHFIFLLVVLLFSSCSESDKGPKEIIVDFNNEEYVMQVTKKVTGEKTNFAFAGLFSIDTSIQIIAGVEFETSDEWGIKFYHLMMKDENLEIIFETELLDGSFNESLVKKIKFPHLNYELLYYNSQNYFLGSGGGEIISYITDFQKKEIYYARFFFDRKRNASIFLSENITNEEIKNFFMSVFKKDYPELKVSIEDVKVDL